MSEQSGENNLNLAHMDNNFLEKNDKLTIIKENLTEISDNSCSTNDILPLEQNAIEEKSNLEENKNCQIFESNLEKSIIAIDTNKNCSIIDNKDPLVNQDLSKKLTNNALESQTKEKRDFLFFPDGSVTSSDNLVDINDKEILDKSSDKSTVSCINGFKEDIFVENDKNSDKMNESAILTVNLPLEPLNSIENNTVSSLEEKVTYQQKVIEENTNTIKFLEEKCQKLEIFRKDLETRLETALKIKDNAVKEKENMVIRYAVGEKNVIKEKQQKEQAEKKFKDSQKENEILQHKVQTMISEKSRICQMLDNKCYELKNCQQELDKTKECLNSVETKIKWSQNSLKSEIEAHKECQVKNETLNQKLQEINDKIEQARKDAEDTVNNFKNSQENKAYVLDQQVKEQQASLILLRHEKIEKEQQIKTLQSELEKLQTKQKEVIQENNNLSQKVQQLERDRLETDQKLRELKTCADQQRNDAANLQTKNVQVEQLKMQLKHEQDQLASAQEQIQLLKQRNQELEADMDTCRVREAELLLFTQQLTDKNVRLQSEFSAMEAKVHQLTTSQTSLKRQLKELETKSNILVSTSTEEKNTLISELDLLKTDLDNTRKNLEKSTREVEDQKGENLVVKRKYEISFREINRELQNCRKKLEQYENLESSSNASSNSPVNSVCHTDNSSDTEHIKTDYPEPEIDKKTLIQHIVKLQKASAKKSEKIDFLEEHVNTLVFELQKKTKLLQGYILREQSGTLTSNNMDKNKAKLAKLNGVMASLYSSKVNDDNLTLELSLDINRKLQAVLEDALLKNITLKENIDTLGNEIDKLNKRLKSS